MQLPSLQDLKRLGPDALTKKLDPSALERGLQYLREGGFRGLEVAVVGSRGFQIQFALDEDCSTRVDMTTSSQPLYSECNCYMAQSAKLCKHQAIAAWVTMTLARKDYELHRVDPEVLNIIRTYEEEFQKLKSNSSSSHPPTILHRDKDYLTHPDLGVSFTGLVLCLPDQRLKGDELPQGDWIVLPESHPYRESLLPRPAIQFYSHSDLPHPRWISPLDSQGGSYALFQKSQDWMLAKKKSLVYLFSDGTRLPVSDILYHKFCTLVPGELHPVGSSISPTFQDLTSNRFFPRQSDAMSDPVLTDKIKEDRLDSILLSITEAASRMSKRGKLNLYFSHTEALDTSGRVLPLESVEFSPPTSLKSGFHFESVTDDHPERLATRVRLDLHPDWTWFPTFALHPEKRTLFFHSFHRWLERYPPETVLTGQRDFERVFNEIQDDFGVSMGEIHAHPPFRTVRSGGFTPQIRVFSNGTFSVELDFDGTIVEGLPGPVLAQLRILCEGIEAWKPDLAEGLSDTRKQAKRSFDRDLLNQPGVAALIQLESIRYLLKKDRPFDTFFEILKKRIVHLFNTKLETPNSARMALELFCSKGAIEYLRSYVLSLEELYQNSTLPLILPGKSLLVSDAYPFYLKLIYAWIARSQRESGTKTLDLKTPVIQNPGFKEPGQMPDLRMVRQDGPHGDHFKIVFNRKQPGAETLIRAFLPLQNEGVILSLDGQPIEELEESDFVSEFILDEKKDQEGRIDWFELQPKFFFKGVEIDEEQARKLSESGMLTFQGKIYRLNKASIPSLEKLAQFWDQLAGNNNGKRGQRKTDRIYRLPKHSTLELLALRASGVRVKGGPIWEEIVKFYDSLNQDRPPLPLPSHFKGDLKPYQNRGVQWIHDLYRLGLGGILADDMGLGKTVQTLVFLELLRDTGGLGHSLIVVPTSLTYNWFSEASRFTPDLPMHIFQSREIQKAKDFLDSHPQGIIISTYGLLAEHEAFFSNYRWTVHVYDEAQNLKTITAKRTTVSRKLPARFKLALTGTPLENHMGEFFSLMDLVVPGSLGGYDQFRKTYMQSYAPDPERIQYLKLKTRPLVLRRNKSSILKELPQKQESTVKIPFTDKQLAIYRDIALSWNSKVREAITEGGEAKSQLIMLTALLRLRQVCSAPSSIPNVDYKETPPKLSLLMDNLKAIIETGESALVFTQFLGTFNLLAEAMKKEGVPFFAMHGKVGRKERESQLRQFQEFPKGAVMLMTLKTGGVGLNLTKASYVFHLEPWWNPAVENQATDRTHRIGQTKPVQVYRYIMSESVEEKIEILKSRKSSQFNSLFSDVENVDKELGEGGSLSLSQSDFEYLLGV
jgi:SNF2 family DNA or RNA helicase